MKDIKEDEGGTISSTPVNNIGGGGIDTYNPLLALNGPKKKFLNIGQNNGDHKNKNKFGKPLSSIIRRDPLKKILNIHKNKPWFKSKYTFMIYVFYLKQRKL